MNELTKKITRSYTKKTNLGNYESFDTMASYSEEFPSDTAPEVLKRASQFLYDQAKADVEEAVLNCKKEIAAERIAKQKKESIKNDNELDL